MDVTVEMDFGTFNVSPNGRIVQTVFVDVDVVTMLGLLTSTEVADLIYTKAGI